MIQRKQSIFLLLSVALFVVTYYFPFGNFNGNTLHSYHVLDSAGAPVESVNNYYFAIPLSIAATLSLIAIFLFGNRQRQMTIVRLTFIFFAASFALLTLYIMNAGSIFTDAKFQFGVSFFLPFGSFFLNMMALRAIKKDEHLVKSVDRIR